MHQSTYDSHQCDGTAPHRRLGRRTSTSGFSLAPVTIAAGSVRPPSHSSRAPFRVARFEKTSELLMIVAASHPVSRSRLHLPSSG